MLYKFYPLILHIRTGKIELIKILLEHNANVNAINTKNQQQPLHIAVHNGNIEIINLLLQNGASQKQEKGLYYKSPLTVCSGLVWYGVCFKIYKYVLDCSSSGKSGCCETIGT